MGWLVTDMAVGSPLRLAPDPSVYLSPLETLSLPQSHVHSSNYGPLLDRIEPYGLRCIPEGQRYRMAKCMWLDYD